MSGITMDASVNAMLGQAQTMSQVNLATIAQAKLAKGVNDMHESAVMTLISGADSKYLLSKWRNDGCASQRTVC